MECSGCYVQVRPDVIYLTVTILGKRFPLNLMLTASQAHESQTTLPLLDGVSVQHKNGFMKRRGKAVLVEKAIREKNSAVTCAN